MVLGQIRVWNIWQWVMYLVPASSILVKNSSREILLVWLGNRVSFFELFKKNSFIS